MANTCFKSNEEVRTWVGKQREYLEQKQRDAVEELINDVRGETGDGWVTKDALRYKLLKRLRSELRDPGMLAAAKYDKLERRLEELYS